jgi:hypothetical protein
MQIDAGVTGTVIDSNILWNASTRQQGYWDVCGCHSITHSIVKDPAFVNAGAHNYQLQAGSPAIGAGNGNHIQPLDKAGAARNSTADLGAYASLP